MRKYLLITLLLFGANLSLCKEINSPEDISFNKGNYKIKTYVVDYIREDTVEAGIKKEWGKLINVSILVKATNNFFEIWTFENETQITQIIYKIQEGFGNDFPEKEIIRVVHYNKN